MPKLQTPDHPVNILILGSDFRPSGGYRTDVIILLTIHPKSKSVSILSFPRDLYIFIPGVGMNRINVAQIYGGFALTQATFQYNFGINVDHYILANFNGFQTIVNTIHGIDVKAESALYDKCDLPQRVNNYCSIEPGVIHMDGATALWYVRSRYSSSDLDRTRRAQEVLIALFNKLISLDALNRINDLGTEFYNN
ncbi:MAG: LCP family protein, partial [Anaerolineaceae bacterium]|nr:LCP family protein [Anaerolineaceae bacterium]